MQTWQKNQRREVWKTFGRFLSILSIIALGVGTFSGLKVTQKAMVDTAQQYFRQYNMFDDRLISTMGLEKDDVAQFAAVDGVKAAEGSISMDVLVTVDNGASYVLAAHSITNDINRVKITSGRMPENDRECVGDARMLDKSAIGSKITISADNDDDTKDAFAYDEYTIVGLADSTTYLNMERGTTKLANGKIAAFVYLPEGAFSTDYYTEVYVTLQNADGRIFTDAYDNTVDAMESPLKAKLTEQAQARYQRILQDAQDELADAEQEYNDGVTEYITQKADAERKLKDAEEELQDAKAKIASGWKTLEKNQKKLDDAQDQYDAGLKAYQQGVTDFETAKTAALAELDASQATIDQNREALNAAMSAAEASGDPDTIAAVQAQIDALNEAQSQLNGQRSAAESQFAATQAKLDATKTALANAKTEIATGKDKIKSGRKELIQAEGDYDKGYQEYLDAKADADQEFSDALRKLEDARLQIEDGHKEIAKIQEPDVYVLNRETNVGYANFENDSSVVNGISKVFPVFFFLVAALVTMTTMARMVEEQRTQIGTLKALGFSDGRIAWKFISYAGGAASLGGIIGFFVGSWVFPWVIWQAYGMLYGFAPIIYTLDWSLFALAMSVALFCSAGVTYLTCRVELRLMPAELMRPKAPKEGKRVFLERIPFVWKRLGFMVKISMRNVFRYTKRLVMMVFGIGGCTALLITGFGLRDSIANIADDQFTKIMTYDFSVVFEDAKSVEQQASFRKNTSSILSESVFVCTDNISVDSIEGIKSVNVIATADPSITNFINLHNGGKTLAYPADGSVVISEKLSKITGVSVGDTIHVQTDEGRETDLPVSAVFENYVYHYMLMTPSTYQKVYGEDCVFEAALANSAIADKHSVAASLLDHYDAANVTVTADIRDQVNNMMTSLNLVIFVIIVCAGGLAFVVLFNLSNINITERLREIATIKVLGFYAPEVGAYVFRENLVLTLLGSLAGIPMGIWLHSFVIRELSFDMASFHVTILPMSFLYSIAMTFVFAFVVDLFMRPRLEKISMVESLKAIE